MYPEVKKAATCKRVNQYFISKPLVDEYTPKAGDVGIFRVVNPNGGYIITPEGESSYLFEGDRVMLAFGNRYATNQYEGYVPEAPTRQCQLLGRGGVAGLVRSKSALFKMSPAQLELEGYAITRSGNVINTIRWKELERFNRHDLPAKVILSVGTSMDSGKTTSAAWLCGGLRAAGKRVAYAKLTGTAFPKDAALSRDRGAHFATDFSEFGFPSTYLFDKQILLDLYYSIVHLCWRRAQVEYVVMEIADGLLQRETAMLLSDPTFRSTLHGVLFSAGDSMGALYGLQLLNQWGIQPFALSGLFTSSELLIREVQEQTQTPVLRLTDLLQEKTLKPLLTQEEPEHNWAEEGIWSDVQPQLARSLRA